MEVKRIFVLAGIFFLVSNGYGGLGFEKELALKFYPTIYQQDAISPEPLGIKGVLYSDSELSSDLEQSSKKTKKGRIVGTLIGTGIGGGFGYILYSAMVESQKGEITKVDKPSSLFVIVPAVVGGLSGYAMGTYYDGITRKEKFGFEEPKKTSKKGRIIGTIIGVGIGGGFGYILYVVAGLSGLGENPREPSSLLIVVPTVFGGTFGYGIGESYDIGKYYDEK